ncbi:MAG: AsmA family protein, partial [Acidobacteria bacterium]
MSRRSVIAVVLAGGFLLALAAYLFVRLALDPERLRVMAEARLSAAFGQPVHIGEMKVRLLPSLSVEGHDIEAGGEAGADPLVGLHSVRIVPRLSTVFSTPIEIDRVELTGLTVAARRGPDGRLVFPLPAAMPSSPAGEVEGRFQIDRVVLHDGRVRFVDARNGEAPAIDDIEAVVSWGGEIARLESLRAAVGSSRLSGSGQAGPDGLKLSLTWSSLGPKDADIVFAMVGAEPPAGFAIEGKEPLTIDLTLDPAGAISATGRVAAERGTAAGLMLGSLGAPLHISNGTLALDPVSYQLYGGKGSGKLSVDMSRSPIRWSFEARGDGVDIGGLVGSLTSTSGKVDGTGRFDARLGGRSGQLVASALEGSARFDVANGAIREFPLLSTIDSIIG